jgi:hypothetical protein
MKLDTIEWINLIGLKIGTLTVTKEKFKKEKMRLI